MYKPANDCIHVAIETLVVRPKKYDSTISCTSLTEISLAQRPKFFIRQFFLGLAKKQGLLVVQVSVLIREKMFIVFPSQLTIFFNLFIKNIATLMII